MGAKTSEKRIKMRFDGRVRYGEEIFKAELIEPIL
jgi:hypothetical protein